MATAPSPNDLTRQQLDELDALLQRMLSVPLPPDGPAGTGSAPREGRVPNAAARGGVESGPAPPELPLPPSWRVDPPAAPRPSGGPAGSPGPGAREGSLPHLTLADPPSSVALKLEPPPSTLAQTPPPAAQLKPVAKTAPPKVPPSPAGPPPIPAVAAPPKATPAPGAPAKAPAGLTPAPPAPAVPFLFLPFVALNVLFDYACGMFGPPGLVLRSGFFKQVYGLIGLGLLIYTGAHVALVRQWITLPVPLPWPE